MKEKGTTMEINEFDAFTRRLGGTGPTRRLALRALGGALLAGALAGVAARLGLTEETEAKPTPGRKPRAERQPHGGPRSEGTRKRTKRRKHQRERRGADQHGCAGGSCSTPDECPPGERRCAGGA